MKEKNIKNTSGEETRRRKKAKFVTSPTTSNSSDFAPGNDGESSTLSEHCLGRSGQSGIISLNTEEIRQTPPPTNVCLLILPPPFVARHLAFKIGD